MDDSSRSRGARIGCAAVILLLIAHGVGAQEKTQAQIQPKSQAQVVPSDKVQQRPLKVGPLVVTGSLRVRLEAWNWFEGNAENTYGFPEHILRVAVSQKIKNFDWQLEMAQPGLFGLPDNAVAPGTQGQLGVGASYLVANGGNRNPVSVFVKQAFVRFDALPGRNGHSVRLGRFEFVDGTEVAPKDATLAALKRDRISHRLIGHFGWSDVGRSVDGLHLALNRKRSNFTFVGARPTRGVFQVDGWGEMDVDFFYGALTQQFTPKNSAGELRVFGLGYHDGRRVLKTDNRLLAVRRADTRNIRIGTYGAHYLHVFHIPGAGKFDLLFWGALQNGRWGLEDHRAGAVAAEAGWQPPVKSLRPWLRLGYFRGSGDRDSSDQKHGTFFQVLPTPRWYARFPFYNLENIEDFSGALILRPHAKVSIRSELHALRLAEKNDLWYQGGGAFQKMTFGYVGRSGDGMRGLGNLWDISVDYQIHAKLSVGLYFSNVWGKGVMSSIYPKGRDARLGYTEFNYRF